MKRGQDEDEVGKEEDEKGGSRRRIQIEIDDKEWGQDEDKEECRKRKK